MTTYEQQLTPAAAAWTPPSAHERLAILRRTRTIAIAGMSTDPSRASYFVATYLLSSSCRFDAVSFVNPKGGEVLGQPVHRSLADLPAPPDMVVAFRRAQDLPAVAEEFVALPGASTFWAQLGLHSDDAVAIVTAAGRTAVTNRCVKIEHARFVGGLHVAGFDTGRISSRRHAEL